MDNYEKDHYWEFTLRDNPLTKDNTEDCVAEVKSGPKTLRNEDIAKEIKRTGSELKYATLLSVTSQSNEIILEALLNGNSVMTDLCQFIPRITGAFDSPEAPFDPAIHRLTFDIILTKSVREALAKVKTVNLGAKGETAGIGLVTDTLTGATNGAITPNDDILIAGNSVKIAGDEAVVGVFFVAEDGTTTKVARRLTQNDPSKLIARVPTLADGNYTLRIVTQFSTNKQLLKEPRTIEYKKFLTVGTGGGDRPEIE